jgi:hypothetical protein
MKRKNTTTQAPPKFVLKHAGRTLGSNGVWEKAPLCGPPMIFHSKTAARKYRRRNGLCSTRCKVHDA